MTANISVTNMTDSPAISVHIDGVTYPFQILQKDTSRKFSVDSGSRQIIFLDSRGKIIFDLWLSLAPGANHIIEVHNSFCGVTVLPTV
ncbi:MAG: hypothetical protein PUE13_00030 [Clostridiales bacterium]|nr:hypothetical protein [Clostridiales bacterium]